MTIDEFEAQVKALIPMDEDCPGMYEERELALSWCWDGCLSATYQGVRIPCEGGSWAQALGVIVQYIRYLEAIELPDLDDAFWERTPLHTLPEPHRSMLAKLYLEAFAVRLDR